MWNYSFTFQVRLNASCKIGYQQNALIDRAWKANVNVWKKHLTLQSVFNRGECMVHVDKNADGHVLNQNVDWISKEIAYVSLSGRIRSKLSSCMQPFFFFFFFETKENKKKIKISTRHAYQWSDGFEVSDVLPRGPWIWNLDMLPRGPKIEFGHASQRSNGLKFRRASQRSDGLESWTCFLEVQGFEFWTCFPEVQ